MGKARFLHTNLVSAASIISAVSLPGSGLVSRGQKEGKGSAVLVAEGPFTGSVDLDYLIQIDAVGTGEVGSSTFRWSDDGGATIDATGVVTSAAPTALNNGVKVSFITGSGQDFFLDDTWRFKAFLPYGKAKAIDLDRDTEFRSGDPAGAGPITMDFDFASAKQVDVLAVLDHNLTSSAIVKIQADDDPAFGSLGVDETVTWRSGYLLHYLTTTPRSFRYWRFRVADSVNADGYLRWSEIFLGLYTELSKQFVVGGFRRRTEKLADRSQLRSGRWFGDLNASVEAFQIEWPSLVVADQTLLKTVYAALLDVSNRKIKPVIFHPDSADLSELFLCEWEGDRDREGVAPGPIMGERLRLVEIPRTA